MFDSFGEQISGNVELNGPDENRLPYNLNIFFEGVESKALIPSPFLDSLIPVQRS